MSYFSGQSSKCSSLTRVVNNDESQLETFLGDIKVKVNRNLLKSMLNEKVFASSEADLFFLRVGEESEAIISYPKTCKLEQLAKNEPEIRVFGTPSQIHSARKLIMEVMDPHKNRVTLKIDVSHTDHSHIIGKKGKRIQSVMDSTGCHIHFPDCNRIKTEEKSNQVTIAGTCIEKVEEARQLIRQHLPLTIGFQVEVNSGNVGLFDQNHPNIVYFQTRYNVLVTFGGSDLKVDKPMMSVYIRGTRLYFDDLKEATRSLYQYLNWTEIGFNNTVIAIDIEIAPQHHPFVMGRNNCNVKAINDHSGAVVTFPNLIHISESYEDYIKKSTVVIRGRGIDSAFMAWLELLGCLPVFLIFDLNPNQEIDGTLMTSLMANQLVNVLIRKKSTTEINNIVLKAQERHSSLLYEARQRILGPKSEPLICLPSFPSINNYLQEQPLGFPRFPIDSDIEPEVLRRAIEEVLKNE